MSTNHRLVWFIVGTLCGCINLASVWAQETDPFSGFDLPQPRPAPPKTKPAAGDNPFADFDFPGESKSSTTAKDPFADFELVGKKTSSSKNPFAGFELPGEAKQADRNLFEPEPKEKIWQKEQELFGPYKLLGEKQDGSHTMQAASLPAPNIVVSGDLLEKVEKMGESTLWYANPAHWYATGKKIFAQSPATVSPAVDRQQPPAVNGTQLPSAQLRPTAADQVWIERLEQEILQNRERHLGLLEELEQFTVEETARPVDLDAEERANTGPMPPSAETIRTPELTDAATITIPIPEAKPAAATVATPDRPVSPWLKFALTEEFTAFALRQSLFNPDNRLGFIHRLHRTILVSTFSGTLYDNQDYETPLSLALYAKDTYVYCDRTYPLSPEFSQNYLQEAFISLQYARLSLTAGKINLRPGDGGGLAWNPTDQFDFPSSLYHPRDGNFQRRGIRSGLWGVMAGYSFPFGTLSLFYGPDLTNNGDVRENSELNNNQENVYYAKFNWILFENDSLIGSLGRLLSPASPDFFVSYFDRQKQLHVGLVWSVGIGSSLLLRLETDYSRKTEISELTEVAPLGTYRQFAMQQRSGDDWLTVVSLLYTLAEFNIDIEYFFHWNGLKRSEWDRYIANSRFLSENLAHPQLGSLYESLLSQAIGYNGLTIGQHYLFGRLSRTLLVGDKKRSLLLQASALVNLQDYSSTVGCGVAYQFFTYAKLEASWSAVLARHGTFLGESPLDSYAAIALELLF